MSRKKKAKRTASTEIAKAISPARPRSESRELARAEEAPALQPVKPAPEATQVGSRGEVSTMPAGEATHIGTRPDVSTVPAAAAVPSFGKLMALGEHLHGSTGLHERPSLADAPPSVTQPGTRPDAKVVAAPDTPHEATLAAGRPVAPQLPAGLTAPEPAYVPSSTSATQLELPKVADPQPSAPTLLERANAPSSTSATQLELPRVPDPLPTAPTLLDRFRNAATSATQLELPRVPEPAPTAPTLLERPPEPQPSAPTLPDRAKDEAAPMAPAPVAATFVIKPPATALTAPELEVLSAPPALKQPTPPIQLTPSVTDPELPRVHLLPRPAPAPPEPAPVSARRAPRTALRYAALAVMLLAVMTPAALYLFRDTLGLHLPGAADSAATLEARRREAEQKARERADAHRAELDGYGWVDRERGVIRIPVQQAMKRIAEAHGRTP
ncbi:MAG: hypothetical protein IPJ65_02565 [Archangiaceae bacterium]|nr:hypothetical protein [Archangiaceae bacterium]